MAKEYKRIRKVFNLLQPKQAPPTAWDGIYVWMVDKARIVLIVAEIIIVAIFLAKVIVDTQAKGLDENIAVLDQKYRTNYTATENRLRALQQKSKSFASVWRKSSNYAELLAEVSRLIGPGASNVVVSFSERDLHVGGFSNQAELAAFENALKSSPNFTEVFFDIKTSGETTNFGIQAKINQEQARAI